MYEEFSVLKVWILKDFFLHPLLRVDCFGIFLQAKEDTDCCTRNICGPVRPFDMIIKDNFDKEVIHLYRPLR